MRQDLFTSEWADLVRMLADDVHTHASLFDDGHSPLAAENTLQWIGNLESTLNGLRENIHRHLGERGA